MGNDRNQSISASAKAMCMIIESQQARGLWLIGSGVS